MRTLQTIAILVALGWALGWVNQDLDYPVSHVLPFSRGADHGAFYNLLLLGALVLFCVRCSRLPRRSDAFKRVANGILQGNAFNGLLKLVGAAALLWGSAWVGSNAGLRTRFDQIPGLRNRFYAEIVSTAQFTSVALMLVGTYLILNLHALALLREESIKRDALDLQFALAQRRRGVPAQLPGPGIDVTDPTRNLPAYPPQYMPPWGAGQDPGNHGSP